MQKTIIHPFRRATILAAMVILWLLRPPTPLLAAGGSEMEVAEKPLASAQTLAKPQTDKNITPEQEKAWGANPEALEAMFRHDQDLKHQVAKQEKKERDYVGVTHRNQLRKKGAERREKIRERQTSFITIRAAAPAAAAGAGDEESIIAGQEGKILFGFALFVLITMLFWKLMFGRKKSVA